jgi:hypothetical protein
MDATTLLITVYFLIDDWLGWSTPELAGLLGTDHERQKPSWSCSGLPRTARPDAGGSGGNELAALLAGSMQLLHWNRITFGTTAAAAEARLRELLANRTLRLMQDGVAPPAPDYRQIIQGEWHPPA